MYRRQVTQDSRCKVCGNAEETTGHVLWQCHHAKEVWNEVGLAKDHVMDSCPEFLDLLWYGCNFKKWSEEDIGLMVMTAWGIWTNWNEVRHGRSRKPATIRARWTKNYLEQYLTANHEVQPYRESVEAVWQLPKPPWYKANMDSATFEQQKEVGIEVVIRDHHGVVVAALSKKSTAPLGALEMEAKAMEEAVEFAWNMGIRDCVFESDAQIVMNAMLHLTELPSSIANIIAGVVSHLHRFRSVQFSHVPCTGNKVAHTLAQYARGVSSLHAWVEETPSCIENLVTQDVTFLSCSE
ncbi:uncharacterized protein LOC115957159 [Quercus lobata]|uniref:uncharacterized protein LOC115957159 n=1 Tax=Quercus lobata TaxID=97700 RepID=UPI001248159A|nr:uncharacterized protein LOC115957159 [Quercus lobata]